MKATLPSRMVTDVYGFVAFFSAVVDDHRYIKQLRKFLSWLRASAHFAAFLNAKDGLKEHLKASNGRSAQRPVFNLAPRGEI
jgi:hypothetical protein